MAEYTIIGAGAIGAITGTALIGAGHAVRFIETNREHVAAVKAEGLRISGFRQALERPVIATPEQADWPLTRVLLAVKSPHTVVALAPFARRLAPDGFVVSLQNGLEEPRIADLVGRERTIGAFLTFGGYWRQPGEVFWGGTGSFKIGEIDGADTPRIRELAAHLAALQPVQVTDNILGFLWSKMALGAIYFATATTSTDVPELYAAPRWRVLFGRLAGEVVAVAEASGVRLETIDGFDPTVFRPGAKPSDTALAATWRGQLDYWNAHDNKRTGVWRDLAIHKRKTEVDRLVGAVIEAARPLGLATPGIARLVAVIQAIEAGERAQGLANLEAIEA